MSTLLAIRAGGETGLVTRPKPSYPPEVRQKAIALAAGGSASAVAHELGLQPRVVQRWVKETDPGELAAIIASKRANAVQQASVYLSDGLHKCQEAHLNASDLDGARFARELFTGWAIMVDKMLLMSGATTQGRFGDASSALPDPRMREIGERILQRLSEQPAPGPRPGTIEVTPE